VKINGCSSSQLDADGDGITDNLDLFPNTINGSPVNIKGCSSSQLDADGDGITDNLDLCPETLNQSLMTSDGCIIENLEAGTSSSIGSGFVYTMLIISLGLMFIIYVKSKEP